MGKFKKKNTCIILGETSSIILGETSRKSYNFRKYPKTITTKQGYNLGKHSFKTRLYWGNDTFELLSIWEVGNHWGKNTIGKLSYCLLDRFVALLSK